MHRIGKSLVTGAALLALASGGPAAAATFRLTYTGWLSPFENVTGPGGQNLVDGPTAFTFVARFDTSSPNLVATLPVPGFVAYSPTSAKLTVAGKTFDVVTAAQDPGYGIGVTLFDRSNVFHPGKYGVGFIANPRQDGAGIVADFTMASPDFSVHNLVPTTFGGFLGAGYLAGIGCAPPDPRPCVKQPIALIGPGGEAWSLGFSLDAVSRDGAPLHAAMLEAVPEPATWATLILGFGAVGAAVRRRKPAWRAIA